MEKRWQRNITLNKEQLKYLKDNFGKVGIRDISAALGLGYNKVHNNLRLLGKVKSKKAKVVTLSNYFDIEQEAKKYYSY